MQLRIALSFIISSGLFATPVIAQSETLSPGLIQQGKKFHHCGTGSSIPTVPPGAPLPDPDIPEDEHITAQGEHDQAKSYMHDNRILEARVHFEGAVNALRKTQGHYNRNLAKKIVSDYAKLLREHGDKAKAKELEKEFRANKVRVDE